MNRLVGPVLASILTLSAMTGRALAQSVYGCSDLDGQTALPVVEGQDGMFFRVDPDLRNFFELSDESVAQIGELADVLAANGTRLIYLPVPTKALAMPGFLPASAADFGFDPDLATTVFLDIIRRLELRGIATVDVRKPMVAAQTERPAHFPTDHRWTPAGARIAARAVASRIAAVPELTALARGSFASSVAGDRMLESTMRAQIQQHCLLTLPVLQTATFVSARIGDATGSARIAVVGTEFSGEPLSNFAGFLSEATGLSVVQYGVPGGGAFAAISSYLTSEAFQNSRPAIVVWEAPVWANPATRGDQPIRELIAAAGKSCRLPLNLYATGQPNRIDVDLSVLDPLLDYTLMVDAAGAASAEADFTFRARNGQSRARSIRRHPGQVHNGVFAMPLSGLWPEGAISVGIELDRPFGPNPRVTACFHGARG